MNKCLQKSFLVAFLVAIPFTLILHSAQLRADHSNSDSSVSVSASSNANFASTPNPEYFGIAELTVESVLADVAPSVVAIFLDPTPKSQSSDDSGQSAQSVSSRCTNWLWPEIGFNLPTIWGVQPVIPQDSSNNSAPLVPQFVGIGLVIDPDGYVLLDARMFVEVDPSSRLCARTSTKGTLPARLVMIDELSKLALLKIETDEALPYHAPRN